LEQKPEGCFIKQTVKVGDCVYSEVSSDMIEKLEERKLPTTAEIIAALIAFVVVFDRALRWCENRSARGSLD
jgi:hypothetical protein